MLIVLLLLAGALLSAFFSGCETGFYRVNPVRLVIDGRAGDRVSLWLLRLTNNPALFVATALVGNNVANYLASLGVVLAAQWAFGDSPLAEIVAPIAFAPLLFVYGELLPKNLFFHAPNLLLRRCGPLFLASLLLFAPVSALLWALGRLLEVFVGQSPEQVRLTLARAELTRVLEESHEAGLLTRAQRNLAMGLFSAAHEPVSAYMIPPARLPAVRVGTPASEVLRLARRQRSTAMPVEQSGGKSRQLIGYVRVIDLVLERAERVESVRPLIAIRQDETLLAAITRMQNAKEMLARVVDAQGETVGLVAARRLAEAFLRRE